MAIAEYVIYDDDPILCAALKRAGMVLTQDGWKHADDIDANDFDGLADAVQQGAIAIEPTADEDEEEQIGEYESRCPYLF